MPTLKNYTCAICGAHSSYSGKYSACPECAFKIHRNADTTFSQKYQDKEFLEILKNYGGDNFHSSYEAAFDKLKAAHQKTMPKLNSTCCICGAPCHKFREKYSACIECSLKVFQNNYPKIPKKDLKEHRKEAEELGGCGFIGWLWNKNIEKVKAAHAPNTKVIFDCHTAETSVCKHGGKHVATHDASTQKSYLVRGMDGNKTWEEVRLCQHHFDTRKDKGWLGSYQWQELTEKTPKLGELQKGQRVEFEILQGGDTGYRGWATVIKGGKDGYIYWDLPNKTSWAATNEHFTSAQELGLDAGKPNVWAAVPGQLKVLRAFQPATEPVKPIKVPLSDLKKGQRVRLRMTSTGDKGLEGWATVIRQGSLPVVYWENKVPDGAWRGSEFQTLLKEYGLDPILQRCWHCYDDQVELLQVEDVQPISAPALDLKDFKEGQRLKITHQKGSDYEHTTWATVVVSQGNSTYGDTALLFFDEEGGQSWKDPAPHLDAGLTKSVCEKIGLDFNAKKFRYCNPKDTIILEKAPEIQVADLKEGDRLHVYLEHEKHYTWATVVRPGSNTILHLDNPSKGEDGKNNATTGHDTIAREYGLPEGYYYWGILQGSATRLLGKGKKLEKIVSNIHIPTKVETKISDCKEGDRVKVEYQSKVSWATVVAAKGNDTGYSVATVLYFDPPGIQGWNLEAGEMTHDHLFPAAAMLGLDATQKLFRRVYDDDTKVLERQATPALKDLKEGDRVYVCLGEKIKTWATVIRPGITLTLYLDTKVDENFGKSWKASDHDLIASKYGLKTGEDNYWVASRSNAQILTQGVSLPKVEIVNVASEADKQEKESEMKTKYRVGEKLRIKIDWHGKELDAHVIQTDGEETLLWLENKNGIGWKPTTKKTIETVQNLGLGRGGAMNCYTMDDDVKVMKRYDNTSEKTKGEEDMSKRKWKVGDRVKIKTTSSYPFTGWGTIISLKGLDGDPNQPLLYMDEEQDDTWPWDEEPQRKAAIKAGLDPEKASFWWLCEDDDTEVLEKEEEEKMEEKNFMGMVKSDAVEAGYRVASTQMTKGVKAGLLRMFKDKGADAGKLAIVQELLDSEVGSAVIALIMGHGMGYIPKLNEDARFQKLAKEFRIGGMSTAGNVLMDTVMQYLAPAVMDAVGNLPPVSEVVNTVSEKAGIKKKTKKRIAPVVRVKDALKVEEHEEEESKKEVLAATG